MGLKAIAMNPGYVIQLLGLIPLFATRTFLPAFLMAGLLLFGHHLPFLGIDELPASGSWLSSYIVFGILAVLSLIELWADKNVDLRHFLHLAEPYMKPAVFLIISMGLTDPASTQALNYIHWAGFSWDYVMMFFSTAGVYVLAVLRARFFDILLSIDEDGDLYLLKGVSWLEDALVVLAFFFLLAAGLIALIFFAIVVALAILLEKRIEARKDKQKIACHHCQKNIHPFAPVCEHCHQPQPQINQIGFWGQKRNKAVENPEVHRLQLLCHRRCPVCGNSLPERSVQQNCTACGQFVFEVSSKAEYLRFVDRRLPKMLLAGFLLGLIPLIGITLCLVISNQWLNAPLKRYVSKGRTLLGRLIIKIPLIVGVFLGSVLGFIIGPVFIAIRYGVWRRLFNKQA